VSDLPESDARSRILDAAEQAFADSGLAGARVAAIVDAAGVNKATLYYYFESKQVLYEAVLERVFDQLIRLARDVPNQGAHDEATALVGFVEGYAGILAQHPQVVRVLLRGILDAPDEALGFLVPRLSKVVPVLAGQVVKGQSNGHVNPDLVAPLVPPSLVAPMVFFTIAGPLLASISGIPIEQLRPVWMRNLRALALDGLRARNPPEES